MKKKIMIYGIGIFFSKIIVFLLVPLYTRAFSSADYGYYDVLISNMTMLVSISFLEIWSGIIRYMFDGKDKLKPIKNFVKLIPAFILIYAIGFIILSFIMDIRFPVLSVIYGLSYLMFTVMNCICRGLNKTVDFVVSGLISSVISCGLSLLCVVVFHKDIKYLLLTQILGFLIAAIYCEVRTGAIRKSLKEKTSTKDVKKMLIYCIPLMINSFSFLFLGTFNKNIIMQELGESSSGYYAFVLKFTSILSIAISIFSTAWQEVAFQNSEHSENGKIFSYYIGLFVKIIGLAIPIYCIVLFYAAPFIGGENYFEATQYIPLAVLATFVSELSGVLSTVIAVSKKTSSILISTILGAGVNVIIVLVTTEKFGINAASFALLIGFSVSSIYRFVASRLHYKIKINPFFLGIIILEMLLTIYAYYVGKFYIFAILILLFISAWLGFNYKFLVQLFRQMYQKIKGSRQGNL